MSFIIDCYVEKVVEEFKFSCCVLFFCKEAIQLAVARWRECLQGTKFGHFVP